MRKWRVEFGIKTFWFSDESVSSPDGLFRMLKSEPEKATLDKAEILVDADSIDEAKTIAEDRVRFYLAVACYKSNSVAEVGGMNVVREQPHGQREFMADEQFSVIGCMHHDTLKDVNRYQSIEPAVALYSQALAIRQAAPDYAYLSYFRALESMAGPKPSPRLETARHIHTFMNRAGVTQRFPAITLDSIRRLATRRNSVGHGAVGAVLPTRQGDLRQCAMDLPEIEHIVRICIEVMAT